MKKIINKNTIDLNENDENENDEIDDLTHLYDDNYFPGMFI